MSKLTEEQLAELEERIRGYEHIAHPIPGRGLLELIEGYRGRNTGRAALEAAEARVEHLVKGAAKSNDEICQALGKALGYPWFKDDHANFPGVTEADGVCVGEHVAESMADEAAQKINELTSRVKAQVRLMFAAEAIANYAWSAVTTDCAESTVYLNKLISRLRAALKDAPSAGEGWKLVPVEPTEAMLRAIDEVDGDRDALEELAFWLPPLRAAIAAAPGPDDV